MEIQSAFHGTIRVEGVSEGFRLTMRSQVTMDEVEEIHLLLEADEPGVPPRFRCLWSHDVVDVQAVWWPGADRDKGLKPDWASPFKSRATSSAPVGCLLNLDGENRLTFAVSDALNSLDVQIGVHEETAVFHNSVTFFTEPSAPIDVYEAILRLDSRAIPYYEALGDVEAWWTSFEGYQAAAVPDIAKRPMYSTWYSFHQQLDAKEVEDQCRMAKAIGCDTIIIDDGWQTEDNQRGYAYCGDWEVARAKIPDMRDHVNKIHAVGMHVILWYNVAFVGTQSKVWDRFSSKLLGTVPDLGAGVLDPRFPDVRDYIIETYETAVRDWDLDGLKIDFVDSFRVSKSDDLMLGQGRDYASIPSAVDRLLSDVMARLRRIKSDIMIEFRQSYIGPLMRHYGNLFRAGDCPNDAIENRVRTIDVRLLAGCTAVHADMLMWHPEEPVESAALQLINVLFAVPQISVRLERLPEHHHRMVSFWTSFWLENRDVLLDGELAPHHPESLYPMVEARTKEKHVVAVYQDTVIQLDRQSMATECIVINGTKRGRVVLESKGALGRASVRVQDCCGETVDTLTMTVHPGLHSVAVPPSGLLTFTWENTGKTTHFDESSHSSTIPSLTEKASV